MMFVCPRLPPTPKTLRISSRPKTHSCEGCHLYFVQPTLLPCDLRAEPNTQSFFQTLVLSLVSELVETSLWTLYKKNSIQRSLLYSQDWVNCYQKTSFSKIVLCLKMAKINKLVSDSQGFGPVLISQLGWTEFCSCLFGTIALPSRKPEGTLHKYNSPSVSLKVWNPL